MDGDGHGGLIFEGNGDGAFFGDERDRGGSVPFDFLDVESIASHACNDKGECSCIAWRHAREGDLMGGCDADARVGAFVKRWSAGTG